MTVFRVVEMVVPQNSPRRRAIPIGHRVTPLGITSPDLGCACLGSLNRPCFSSPPLLGQNSGTGKKMLRGKHKSRQCWAMLMEVKAPSEQGTEAVPGAWERDPAPGAGCG